MRAAGRGAASGLGETIGGDGQLTPAGPPLTAPPRTGSPPQPADRPHLPVAAAGPAFSARCVPSRDRSVSTGICRAGHILPPGVNHRNPAGPSVPAARLRLRPKDLAAPPGQRLTGLRHADGVIERLLVDLCLDRTAAHVCCHGIDATRLAPPLSSTPAAADRI